MKIVLEDAVIVEANASKDDPRRLFLEVAAAEAGRFAFELNGQTRTELGPYLCKPVRLAGKVRGRLWQGSQRLILEQVELVPLYTSGNGGTPKVRS